MKIAVALLTCDRYDYTVKTVESFLEHNNPDDFMLFHGDDASTEAGLVRYVQSKGFETLVQHTDRRGCSPTTDELLHAVAQRVDPGTIVLYLQNDMESIRPLPQQQVRDLLARPDISFLQLSYRKPRSRYAEAMPWVTPDGQPWTLGDKTHDVVYSEFKWGMGYLYAISDLETWLPAVKGVKSEKQFIARTEYTDRKIGRITNPVLRGIGFRTTPSGRFGGKRKDRRARKEATRRRAPVGVAVPAYGVPQEVVERFMQNIPGGVPVAVHNRPVAGVFNLARAKNRAIRELLDTCNIVAATDIDCLIPPGLLESLPNQVKDGVAVWNPARNVHELNGDSWDQWQKLPLRKTGKGSFVAMTSDDWRKTGGFDERYCYGWGDEDIAFARRRKAMGIRTTQIDYPLVHIMHPRREWVGSRKRRRRRPKIPSEYTVNYMTDPIPKTGGVVMWVTSACPMSCEDCNQFARMQADPDYHMTPNEVNLLCDCADASDKRVPEVHLTGGEPLLWKYLREGVTRLNECRSIGPIWVFTSGMGLNTELDWLAENVDHIRLSRHPNNWRRVKSLYRRLRGHKARIKIADKRKHTPIPDKPILGTLPGSCVCPSVCYTKGQAYVCPNIATLLAQHGEDWQTNPGLIERMGPNFMDIRRYLGRSGANISWCQLCVGNRRVARHMAREVVAIEH